MLQKSRSHHAIEADAPASGSERDDAVLAKRTEQALGRDAVQAGRVRDVAHGEPLPE